MQPKLAAKPDDTKSLDGAGCRVDDFLKVLAREWTTHIVWTLASKKSMRFGALRRALPGAVSARVLSIRLKELESYGLVSRHDAGKLPLHVEYRLTSDGRVLHTALRRSEALTSSLRKRPIKKA
jgi:DNA-binding HxlR family transcriptional regulator